MSSRPVISARGIGKRYKLGATLSPNTLRDHLAAGAKRLFGRRSRNREESRSSESLTPGSRPLPPDKDFWALKDIDFDIHQGEVVGIIGHNGAGKSTLLKVLSQITEPTEGEINIRGRIAALLEVGTGFHPELSGRENIYMNGAILGMSKAEIRGKFDEIVDFAGVEQFLDTPVKRYSSGMTVRLGFAVAAHLEPEVLVVDEVLAVGDAEFQRKCLGKMREVSRSGRTILFVSHNMSAITQLCERTLLLDHGSKRADTRTEDALGLYLSTSERSIRKNYSPEVTSRDGGGLISAIVECPEPCTVGEDIGIAIELARSRPIQRCEVAVSFKASDGTRVLYIDNSIHSTEIIVLNEPRTVTIKIPEFRLYPDVYHLDIRVRKSGGEIEMHRECLVIEIKAGDPFSTGKLPLRKGGIYLPQSTILIEES